jgi:hypothetical protein
MDGLCLSPCFFVFCLHLAGLLFIKATDSRLGNLFGAVAGIIIALWMRQIVELIENWDDVFVSERGKRADRHIKLSI